jgi:hypothetical protein
MNNLKLQDQLLSSNRLASRVTIQGTRKKGFDKRDQGTYPPPTLPLKASYKTPDHPIIHLNSPCNKFPIPMHSSRLQKRPGHRIMLISLRSTIIYTDQARPKHIFKYRRMTPIISLLEEFPKNRWIVLLRRFGWMAGVGVGVGVWRGREVKGCWKNGSPNNEIWGGRGERTDRLCPDQLAGTSRMCNRSILMVFFVQL